MKLADRTERLIRRSGQRAVLEKDGRRQVFWAVVNPVFGKGTTAAECGQVDQGKYLLICLADDRTKALEAGDCILWGGRGFCIERIQGISCQGKDVILQGSLSLVEPGFWEGGRG